MRSPFWLTLPLMSQASERKPRRRSSRPRSKSEKTRLAPAAPRENAQASRIQGTRGAELDARSVFLLPSNRTTLPTPTSPMEKVQPQRSRVQSELRRPHHQPLHQSYVLPRQGRAKP